MVPISPSLPTFGRTDRRHVVALAQLPDGALVAVLPPGGGPALAQAHLYRAPSGYELYRMYSTHPEQSRRLASTVRRCITAAAFRRIAGGAES